MEVSEWGAQILRAVLYYFGLLILARLAGKRLAGQTTTFDLVVFISLAVVLQTTALIDGTVNAFLFVGTVLFLHRSLAFLMARSTPLRHFLRGSPRTLVRDGHILDDALIAEGLSHEELLAGLRKIGHPAVNGIKLAVLEETGHISAIARE